MRVHEQPLGKTGELWKSSDESQFTIAASSPLLLMVRLAKKEFLLRISKTSSLFEGSRLDKSTQYLCIDTPPFLANFSVEG